MDDGRSPRDDPETHSPGSRRDPDDPAGSGIRAFSYGLGECGVTFFALPDLAATLRPRFPTSLHDARMLLPGPGSALRRVLDEWLDRLGIEPEIVGEVGDSALLKAFGHGGAGVFAAAVLGDQPGAEDPPRRGRGGGRARTGAVLLTPGWLDRWVWSLFADRDRDGNAFDRRWGTETLVRRGRHQRVDVLENLHEGHTRPA